MLQLDIGWIAKAKNVESAAVFLRERGFTTRETRSLTQPGGIKLVRVSTLQRLCEAAVCTPNELFRYSGDAKSHLRFLNTFPPTRPADLLKHMPQAAIDALIDKAKETAMSSVVASDKLNGKLQLNVLHLIEQRQQPRPQRYLMHMGFTRMEARKLIDPQLTSIKVTMLFRLCLCFTCMPNDLFDWDGSDAHHLNTLKKAPAIDLQQLLNTMTPQEAKRFLQEIRKNDQ